MTTPDDASRLVTEFLDEFVAPLSQPVARDRLLKIVEAYANSLPSSPPSDGSEKPLP